MVKLIVQIAVAAVVILGGRYFGLAWWLTAGLVTIVAVFVHIAWVSLAGGGTRHLGARAIAEDDPLMLAALARARATWPEFVALYPQHREESIVKFRLVVKDGTTENVWGDLVELQDDGAKVYLRTPPVGAIEMPSRHMTVPLDDIVDWQIMFPDGSLRGGFTQQATFQIYEREEGHLPVGYKEQLERYREI